MGDISPDETERIDRGSTCRVVVIGIVFILISIVTNAFHDQPADQRMAAHDQAEGRPFHVDRDCAAYRSSYFLERTIGSHRVPGGHRLEVACCFAPLTLFRRRWGAFQTRDERLPIVEQSQKL